MIPFQLGVITDEISHDFDRALDVMLEYDVRQVEIRELWGKNALQLTADEMSAAREAVKRRGMTVCSIASPFYKCSLGIVTDGSDQRGEAEKRLHGATEATLAEQMGILQRACELAHFFGAPLVRVFAFWRDTPMTPTVFQAIQDAFRQPLELAEKENLVLGLENEASCMLGTGVETAAFLNAVNHPRLRCVWDPGNAFHLDEHSFPEGYNAVKKMVAHVHVKDGRRIVRKDGKVDRPWTVMGEGEIDYAGQFQALAQDGYRGVVSLETHYRNSQNDPETSSRACLEGIQRLLQDTSAVTA